MEEKVRLHLWRVHASSFLALVASQILVAGFLYVVQPDLTSRKIQRQIKRHASVSGDLSGGSDRSGAARPTPHTIWTRLDILTGDKRLKPDPALRKQRDASRELWLHVYKQEKRLQLDHLKAKATRSFEQISADANHTGGD